MKNVACMAFLLLVVFLIVGCGTPHLEREHNQEEQLESESEYMAGWIVINDGILYLDEARVYVLAGGEDDPFLQYASENFIVADANEIEQLGINMPNMRHVISLDRDIVSFELTGDTIFTFFDTQLLFIPIEDIEMGRRIYHTTDVSEFLLHRLHEGTSVNRLYCEFNTDYTMTPEAFLLRKTCDCATYRHRNPIVILRIQDGKVVSVIEEFLFTQ